MTPSLFSVFIKPKHVKNNLDSVVKDMHVHTIIMQRIEEEILKSSNTDRRHVRLSKKLARTGRIPKRYDEFSTMQNLITIFSVIKVTIAQCATREPNNSSILTFIKVQSVMICSRQLIVREGPFVPLPMLNSKNMTKMDTRDAFGRGPTRMPSSS